MNLRNSISLAEKCQMSPATYLGEPQLSRKSTRDEFINHSNLKHEFKYTYPNTVYINNKTKVCITCPDHGDFWMIPSNHLHGKGCMKCASEVRATLFKRTDSQFIEESIKIQGGKYTYPKVIYVNNCTKVCITCPVHGDFWQKPAKHLNGRGCLKCSKVARITNEEIDIRISNKNIARISDYKTGHKMKWKCLKPKCNHIWTTTYSHISNDRGCPRCNISKGNRKLVDISEKNNLIFETEKTFDDCRNPKTNRMLKFDMCIFNIDGSIKCLVEFDGEQHENQEIHDKFFGKGKNSFSDLLFRDRLKNTYCESKNLKLIRINFRDTYHVEDIFKENGII